MIGIYLVARVSNQYGKAVKPFVLYVRPLTWFERLLAWLPLRRQAPKTGR
jgi:hypothetical protein